MGSTQVIPSFPASVWDGTSPSRPSATSDRPPTASDYSRLVSELQALQQWVRDQIGLIHTVLTSDFLAGNYTATAQGGGVDFGVPDGKPAYLAIVGGALTGDSTWNVQVEESDDASTWAAIQGVNVSSSVALRAEILSFTPTKRYARPNVYISGADHDLYIGTFFGKGALPILPANNVGFAVQHVTGIINGTAVDFGNVTGKFDTAFIIVSNISGDPGGIFTIQQSTNGVSGWSALPGGPSYDAISMGNGSVGSFTFKRTRRYARLHFDPNSLTVDSIFGGILTR